MESSHCSTELLAGLGGHFLAEKRTRKGREGRLRKGNRGELAPKWWVESAVPEMQLSSGIVGWLRAMRILIICKINFVI